MTNEVQRVSLVPSVPAVYALYGGRGRSLHIAYVGVAENLRRRLEQHLEHRNSSVTTGAGVVGVNPELVTEVRWWTHPTFEQKDYLRAAEIIAFRVLDPVLRSRASFEIEARRLALEPAFAEGMDTLFLAPPSGRLVVPTLQDAFDRIALLEQRLDDLSRRLEKSL